MKALTKQELIDLGVTNVLEDGTVYVNGEIKQPHIYTKEHKYGSPKSYVMISLQDKRVKKPVTQKYLRKKTGEIATSPGWVYGIKSFQLGRLVLAWFYNEVPANMDADHIDNNPMNNHLSNLQMLTRKENLARRLLSWKDIARLYHERMKEEGNE